MTVEEKLQRSIAITDRETKAYVYAARAAGLTQAYVGDAVKLWTMNTLAEHYRSLPAADDPGMDAQILADLDALADAANAAFDAGDPLPKPPGKYATVLHG